MLVIAPEFNVVGIVDIDSCDNGNTGWKTHMHRMNDIIPVDGNFF
jgi:hypothetical protein